MNGKIYILTNKVNRKQYVGQTVMDIEARINKHVSDSKNGTSSIESAIRTHRAGNFEYKVLKDGITTQTNLNYWENYYIRLYGTRYPNGYNEVGGL